MKQMSSMERVLTTLGHNEPDRVPLLLPLTLHGAKELDLPIETYFSRPENIVRAQVRLRERYSHDAYFGFYYAAQEIEAFGGQVLFYPDGPPNAGAPVIQNPDQIFSLETPDFRSSARLCQVLDTIKGLKDRAGDDVPVIGVVISPFSLPVMQMGFEAYIELIYDQPDLFDILMGINTRFCLDWANAQIDAGASAICYFDPVSSPTIVPKDLSLKTGFKTAEQVISSIRGPVCTHLASGRTLPVIDDLARTGAVMVGCSAEEDISQVKEKCRNKMTVLGNLNGVTMRRWSDRDAADEVKKAINAAAPHGGFVLSDNHGEIPWQVKDKTLSAISEAVSAFGSYPIKAI